MTGFAQPCMPRAPCPPDTMDTVLHQPLAVVGSDLGACHPTLCPFFPLPSYRVNRVNRGTWLCVLPPHSSLRAMPCPSSRPPSVDGDLSRVLTYTHPAVAFSPLQAAASLIPSPSLRRCPNGSPGSSGTPRVRQILDLRVPPAISIIPPYLSPSLTISLYRSLSRSLSLSLSPSRPRSRRLPTRVRAFGSAGVSIDGRQEGCEDGSCVKAGSIIQIGCPVVLPV